MFEAEINHVFSSKDLPADVLDGFKSSTREIEQRTMLFWGEHCTECVFPSCYSSCELFEAREDGKCRRFINGMQAFKTDGIYHSSILKIEFKRWAKLWSPGGLRLYGRREAIRVELKDLGRSSRLQRLPKPYRIRKFGTLYDERKKRAALSAKVENKRPDVFLFECFNPQSFTLNFNLQLESEKSGNTYIHLLKCKPGFNSHLVELAEIEQYIDLNESFSVAILPNSENEGICLYFGIMDFVSLTHTENKQKEPLSDDKTALRIPKCIVWDLDDTLWDGTVAEDGLTNILPRQDVLELIRKIDSLGILQSISSKNNEEDGFEALKMLGIQDFFLYPKISWKPKREGIVELSADLNIGLDSIHFIDNSEMERAEMETLLNKENIWDADRLEPFVKIIERVAEEGRLSSRRVLYQDEEKRKSHSNDFIDHKAFVRSLNMVVSLTPKPEHHFERLYELAQRTNQLNFTGNRYGKGVLQAMLEDPFTEICAIFCRDKFGDYGLIGMCIIDQKNKRISDLALSCRVQGRYLESVVLWEVWRRFNITCAKFSVNTKNQHLLEKLQKAGISIEKVNESEHLLKAPEQAPQSVDLMVVNWNE